MAKYGRVFIAIGLVFSFFSLNGASQDLCLRVDMKPILSMDQVRMADMAHFMCEISGITRLPSWPSNEEIAQMTPEEFYKMEIQLLAENGFPPIFMEMEADRLVNRRFFNQLMFQIAMETDERVRADCQGATTETEQVECMNRNDWLFNQAGRIYRNEILSILCEKKQNLESIVPAIGGGPAIGATQTMEGIIDLPLDEDEIEKPATPFR